MPKEIINSRFRSAKKFGDFLGSEPATLWQKWRNVTQQWEFWQVGGGSSTGSSHLICRLGL